MKNALILQHAETEGPGLFGSILDDLGWSRTTLKLYENADLPANASDCHLLLIMGGPMNADEVETYPFLKAETELIRTRIEQDLPTLGICLGSQLIAKAAGARVYAGPVREIGWYNVDLTEEGKRDPHLGNFDSVFSVFHWHGDTFDLPKGAVRLVTSYPYSNQAFRMGKSVYAFQFHLEVTLAMIETWVEECRNDPVLYEDTIQHKLLERASFHIPPIHLMARDFLQSFLRGI